MRKILVPFMLFVTAFLPSFCELVSYYDISAGWRRDYLSWKNSDLKSSYACGKAKSNEYFRDINSYVISGKGKWLDNECDSYYFRASADYGFVQKGDVHENFKLKSRWLYSGEVSAHTETPIHRHSEVYDFSGAAGIPFTLCSSRLLIAPVVGFAFNRQHLSVRPHHSHSLYSYLYPSSSGGNDNNGGFFNDDPNAGLDQIPFEAVKKPKNKLVKAKKNGKKKLAAKRSGKKTSIKSKRSGSSSYESSYLSNSSFYVESSNPFAYYFVSDPFEYSSWSHEGVASHLGLSNPHDDCSYRFTWYGFYLGVDLAYALDCEWSLYGQFEAHFLDKCHRKRKSWTGVQFVDHYHSSKNAYGFNGLVGLNYAIDNCWYATASAEMRYWESNTKHDKMTWQSVDITAGVGIIF